ncbi:MAG: hypothetical protein ACK4ND_15105 [Cytophagaceae bacterium]
MYIQTKYRLIEKIMESENDVILSQVKAILDEDEKDFWEELNPELNESIKIGLSESQQGKGRPHAEVMAEIRKKYQS